MSILVFLCVLKRAEAFTLNFFGWHSFKNQFFFSSIRITCRISTLLVVLQFAKLSAWYYHAYTAITITHNALHFIGDSPFVPCTMTSPIIPLHNNGCFTLLLPSTYHSSSCQLFLYRTLGPFYFCCYCVIAYSNLGIA